MYNNVKTQQFKKASVTGRLLKASLRTVFAMILAFAIRIFIGAV